jgi:hypothetical protein
VAMNFQSWMMNKYKTRKSTLLPCLAMAAAVAAVGVRPLHGGGCPPTRQWRRHCVGGDVRPHEGWKAVRRHGADSPRMGSAGARSFERPVGDLQRVLKARQRRARCGHGARELA